MKRTTIRQEIVGFNPSHPEPIEVEHANNERVVAVGIVGGQPAPDGTTGVRVWIASEYETGE